jgi:hypothetical protein
MTTPNKTEGLLEALQAEAMTAFGTTWVHQGLENISKLASNPSAHSLQDAFSDRPAIIIDPGPALEKNAPLLRQLKTKALLISFSYALQTLKKLGVTPDVVIVLDSQDVREHFVGYPVEQIEVLMLGVTAYPLMYQLPAKRIFTFAGNASLDKWLLGPLAEEMPVLSVNADQTARLLAQEWGCEPILSVGEEPPPLHTKESCQLCLAQAILQSKDAPGLLLQETLHNAQEKISYKSRRNILVQQVDRMLSALEICEQRAKHCSRLLHLSSRSLKDMMALSNAEDSLLKTLKDATFLSFVIPKAIQDARCGSLERNDISRALYDAVIKACFALRPRVRLALQQLKRQGFCEPTRASL